VGRHVIRVVGHGVTLSLRGVGAPPREQRGEIAVARDRMHEPVAVRPPHRRALALEQAPVAPQPGPGQCGGRPRALVGYSAGARRRPRTAKAQRASQPGEKREAGHRPGATATERRPAQPRAAKRPAKRPAPKRPAAKRRTETRTVVAGPAAAGTTRPELEIG